MNRSVLRAGTHGGPLLADTRSWTLRATLEGAVVSCEPGGVQRLVARPGEVDRMVLVRGEQLGARASGRLLGGRRGDDVVALLGDDDVLLGVPVRHLHLGRPHGDPDMMRATSGAADFALSIGLTLELATADDVARVRAAPGALTRGPAQDALARRRALHGALVAWLVAAVIARTLIDSDSAVAVLVSNLLLLVPLVLLAVDAWRGAEAFFSHRPPAADDRIVVPNVAPDDQWTWVRDAQLQIGADDVVHVEHGMETWLPGPRVGGVVRCSVSPDAIWFWDRHDVPLAVVPAAPWTGAHGDVEALSRACRAAGIELVRRREPDLPAMVAADLDPAVYASYNALLFLVPLHDRGVLLFGTTLLTAVGGVFIGAGSAAVQVDTGLRAADMVGAVVGLAVVAATIALVWRARAWNRSQMAIERPARNSRRRI
jgi:hypothetical protein